MKITKDAAGVNEAQSAECVPDGPIRLALNGPDTRARIHKDGSKSNAPVERPAYASNPIGVLRDQIAALEAKLNAHIAQDHGR